MVSKFDRIPPKLTDEEFFKLHGIRKEDVIPPLYPSKYGQIQYEGSAHQELDRMVDKWHKEKFGEE